MESNTGGEEDHKNGSEPSSEDIDEFIKTRKIDAKSNISSLFVRIYVFILSKIMCA